MGEEETSAEAAEEETTAEEGEEAAADENAADEEAANEEELVGGNVVSASANNTDAPNVTNATAAPRELKNKVMKQCKQLLRDGVVDCSSPEKLDHLLSRVMTKIGNLDGKYDLNKKQTKKYVQYSACFNELQSNINFC